jgi:hypothetical protein
LTFASATNQALLKNSATVFRRCLNLKATVRLGAAFAALCESEHSGLDPKGTSAPS